MTLTVSRGLGIGRGVAVGPVAIMRPAPVPPAGEAPAEMPEAAAREATAAFVAVADDLRRRCATSSGALADVLGATALMAEDAALLDDVERRILVGAPTCSAVDEAVEAVGAVFSSAGGYLAERVTDLRSVKDRVLARLLGCPEPGLTLSEPSVVVAVDLSPADTAALDLDSVLAIVTEVGGPTGHTAIIAGQLGLPCVVQVPGVTTLPVGTTVVVDAGAGTVTADPGAELVAWVARRRAAAEALAGDRAPGATRDGHRIALVANVGTPEDALRASAAGAEGVGLFRTEVLFLDRRTAPTAREQESVYRKVFDAFAGRKVVVRTLDAGADKPLAFAQQATEENPALGVRGYRLVRTLPELMATQLGAVARAAEGSGAEVAVMAPMVATVVEANDFTARARAAGLRTVGVMVEVPAAALQAERLLEAVDFVSLGTNDLAQYTMATDRLRGELGDLLDPWQPAVLQLVAATASAARAAGKPVGVCGESAADPVMGLVLVGLGVTSLSMAPAALAAVRFALRSHSLAQCRAIAAATTAAPDAASSRQAALALVADDVRHTLGL
ncbi:phosphoenolpyruvate--protein phosphotransferase [Cellulomonas sp. KRMCY2]|uniref:phosphoenolpyruvate--protein phosphotransferase n=1 Tax=Cellulomonas sp. KRMCY2 TaxID=1304865 RepID=UPI00045E9A5B|nr:putative PEP-binding protein [Cellulomonas sp. KRMCY2]